MKSSDLTNSKREEAKKAMQEALKNNDSEAFSSAMNQMMDVIAEEIREDARQQAEEIRDQQDSAVLAARGVHQLTSKEKEFYQKFGECIKAKDPKQALSNMSLAFPETVINAVFDELRTNHPLLSRIDFIPTGAAVKMIMNTNGLDRATWGALCDEITKEASAGIKVVDATLFKLSAFIFVCKQLLILGPEWLDRFVRDTLYEMYANGLEYGFITGTGKDEPIGMDRQVGEDVVVTAGVYPQKEKIVVPNFNISTIGNLISLLAVNDNGKPRAVCDLIMVVNPADYFSKVFPAVYIMAPDGTWRNTMPYPVEIIQSPYVTIGEAVFGMAKRYFANAGSSLDGNIDYSDHYRYIEDERTYIVKGFANGMPKDNSSFLRLDISGVQPPVFKFENVTYVPSTDATLASLKIGTLTLDPEFDPEEDTYEADTTNATNTVTAVPSDAGATVVVTVNDTVIQNGSAATWENGENEVVVSVTAEDGETTAAYTVTVTKT